MLEAFGQALGALGRLVLEPGGDGARDGEQFRLDAAAQAPRAPSEQPLQSRDRALEAGHRVAFAPLAPLRKVDDRSHGAIVDRGYDKTPEPTAFRADKVLNSVARGDNACFARPK